MARRTPVDAQPPTDLVNTHHKTTDLGDLRSDAEEPWKVAAGGTGLPLSSRSGTSLAVHVGFGLGRVVCFGRAAWMNPPVSVRRFSGRPGQHDRGHGGVRQRDRRHPTIPLLDGWDLTPGRSVSTGRATCVDLLVDLGLPMIFRLHGSRTRAGCARLCVNSARHSRTFQVTNGRRGGVIYAPQASTSIGEHGGNGLRLVASQLRVGTANGVLMNRSIVSPASATDCPRWISRPASITAGPSTQLTPRSAVTASGHRFLPSLPRGS